MHNWLSPMDVEVAQRPLVPPFWGKWLIMVEYAKVKTTEAMAVSIPAWIGAFSAVAALIAVLMGWISTGATNQHDLAGFRAQLDGLDLKVSRLSDKIEAGPRVDQLADMAKTYAAFATAATSRAESQEARLRTIELLQERQAAKMENLDQAMRSIEQASRANIQGRR